MIDRCRAIPHWKSTSRSARRRSHRKTIYGPLDAQISEQGFLHFLRMHGLRITTKPALGVTVAGQLIEPTIRGYRGRIDWSAWRVKIIHARRLARKRIKAKMTSSAVPTAT